MKKLIIAAAIIASFSAVAKAPFGIEWGEQITNYGEFKEIKNGLGAVNNASVKKRVSTLIEYSTIGTLQDGVLKVQGYSETIKDDIYGTKGKELYSELVSLLESAGYVKKIAFNTIGDKIYKDSDEFYQCLDYSGCGSWAWFGDHPDGETATVEIEGISRGKGLVIVSVQSKDWPKVIKKSKSKQKSEDSKAF